MLNLFTCPARLAAIGGTFDTLHLGHKDYINLAFENALKVRIYLSTDRFVQNKKEYQVRSFDQRKKLLIDFIRPHLIGMIRPRFSNSRYEIVPLDRTSQLKQDYLNDEIDLSIVSPDYYHFFQNLNDERLKLGRKPFLILVKHRTRNERNLDISSTTERNGKAICPPPPAERSEHILHSKL